MRHPHLRPHLQLRRLRQLRVRPHLQLRRLRQLHAGAHLRLRPAAKSRRSRANHRGTALATVATACLSCLAGLGLSACSSNGQTTTTTTRPLPPLPPTVLAYVALAGAGNNLGFGDGLEVVNISLGSTGAEQRIPVGTYPDAVAVAPGGRTAYVTDYASNDVTPVDLVSGRAEHPIAAGVGPSAIAITPDGSTAYVTDAGDSVIGDTVTPINLRTRRPGRPITVGRGPQGIVITPDGARAYVSDAGAVLSGQSGPAGNQVTPIDLTTGTPMAPIPVGNAPIGLAVTPDGSTVFVANLNSESVTPISVSTNSAGAAIGVPGGPISIVATSTDAWVVDTAATGNAGNNVVPIAVKSLAAGTPIPVGKGAQAIALAPDGRSAWVACLAAQTIEEVNLVSRRPSTQVRVAGGPFAIAIASEPAAAAKAATKK